MNTRRGGGRTPALTSAALLLNAGARLLLERRRRRFFESLATKSHMSGRAIMRTLALARTIADMEQAPAVGHDHICEAVGFRVREGGAQ